MNLKKMRPEVWFFRLTISFFAHFLLVITQMKCVWLKLFSPINVSENCWETTCLRSIRLFSPQSKLFFKRFLRICNRFFCQKQIWMLVMNKTLPKALAAFNNSKIIQPLHIICGTVWLSHSTRVKSFFQQVSSVYYSESASIGAFEPKSQWQGLLMIGLGSDERNSSSFLHKM